MRWNELLMARLFAAMAGAGERFDFFVHDLSGWSKNSCHHARVIPVLKTLASSPVIIESGAESQSGKPGRIEPGVGSASAASR